MSFLKDHCRNCMECRNGDRKYCDKLVMCGVFVDVAAAEYMADSAWAVILYETIPFDVGTSLVYAGTFRLLICIPILNLSFVSNKGKHILWPQDGRT